LIEKKPHKAQHSSAHSEQTKNVKHKSCKKTRWATKQW